MPSLWAASEEAIFDSVCMVSVRATMSGGHERVHVMFVCHVHMCGTVGHVRKSSHGPVANSVLVYKNLEGKGLKASPLWGGRTGVRS